MWVSSTGTEETNSGYLLKLSSWGATVSYEIHSTDTYYVILVCEGNYTPGSVPPEIYVTSYVANVFPPPLVNIAPGSVTMDLGQSQLFNSTVSGGVSPYSYQWYLSGATLGNIIVNSGFETGNFNGWNQEGPYSAVIRNDEQHSGSYCCASPYNNGSFLYLPFKITQKLPSVLSDNVANVSCWYKYGTAGDWLRVNYTDGSVSSVNLAWSSVWTQATLNLAAHKTLDSLILERNSSSSYIICIDDVGFITNFTSVSGATGSAWTFSPSSLGSYEVYVQVMDNAGFLACSNIANVTVNDPPSVAISPYPSVIMDLSQSQSFNSTVTDGTSPYSYQWYLNGAPVTGATNATWTFTPTSAGSYTVYLNVTDAASAVAISDTNTVTVNDPPYASISPSSSTLDVGGQSLIYSVVSNGTPPYTYQWYLNGSAVPNATSESWIFIPTSSGPDTIYLNVTDSVGVIAISNTATVTVNDPPYASISPNSSTLDVGGQSLIYSVVSNGTPPYTYQWYLNGSAVPNATSSNWTFTPTSSGSYTVYLNVTDSVGVIAISSTATVTVNTPISASILPSSVIMDLGQSQTFNSTVSGGTGSYSYQWYLNGAPQSNATTAAYTFTPPLTGSNIQIYVIITDNIGTETPSNTATVTVNGPLSASVLPLSVIMDVGQTELFPAAVSGGTSPYTYQWYLDGSPVGTNSSGYSYNATAGSHEVYVNVTDSASVSVTVESDTAAVAVNSAVTVSIAPASWTMDVGQAELFTATVSGDTASFLYQWYLNDSAVSGATGVTWTFAPASAGYYTVYVEVTDAANFTATSTTANATVNSALSVSMSPTSITLEVDQSQTFNSTVSGGTSPYTYQWFLNGSVQGETLSSWAFTPTLAGSYTIYANVTDNIGVQATSSTATVTVNIHDVAVTDVVASRTVVGQGCSLNVSVTTADPGDHAETFNVTVYANTTYITSQNVTLSSGTSTTLALTWNTTGFPYGNYTLSAYALPVPGETNTSNNNFTGGWIIVSLVGDITGPSGWPDGQVNMRDVAVVARAFGSDGPNYLYPGSPPSANWNPNADINGHDTVNMKDIALVARNFGQHYP